MYLFFQNPKTLEICEIISAETKQIYGTEVLVWYGMVGP